MNAKIQDIYKYLAHVKTKIKKNIFQILQKLKVFLNFLNIY